MGYNLLYMLLDAVFKCFLGIFVSMFVQDISLLFPFLVMSLSGFDINAKDGIIWKVFLPLTFYEENGMNLNRLVNTFKVAAIGFTFLRLFQVFPTRAQFPNQSGTCGDLILAFYDAHITRASLLNFWLIFIVPPKAKTLS